MNTKLKENTKLPLFTCKAVYTKKILDISRLNNTSALIYFWAVECEYCTHELIKLSSLFNTYKENTEFIYINCGDTEEEIINYITKNSQKIQLNINNISENIYSDYNDNITTLLNVENIPTTLIIKKNLIINNILIGKNKIEKYKSLIEKNIEPINI